MPVVEGLSALRPMVAKSLQMSVFKAEFPSK
jgi:hypothetical protein